MNNYLTNRLPTVECCACSERQGERCPSDSCLRKCRGNYCVVDFDGIEQEVKLSRIRVETTVFGYFKQKIAKFYLIAHVSSSPVAFDTIEAVMLGCGLGFPRLQSFLRMNNYLDYQGSPICARYV
ncbi:unnamed protein product [Cylicostephanus goldi]|uniref:Uncharacterized protein n=1 Tax=Cylicostephanus goldi TaxID=71465 RepID=A0A3P6SKF1_CYLGO|nr:unnamed protein product [Cylicostephanus goldi]